MGSKLLPQPSDPGMSSSQAGQGCGLEPFQGIDFRVLLAKAFMQSRDLGSEPLDPSSARVGLLPRFLGGGPPTVELGLQVR
ncbi:hypothetical protein ACWDSD_44775 [Streptomyces spiralis]